MIAKCLMLSVLLLVGCSQSSRAIYSDRLGPPAGNVLDDGPGGTDDYPLITARVNDILILDGSSQSLVPSNLEGTAYVGLDGDRFTVELLSLRYAQREREGSYRNRAVFRCKNSGNVKITITPYNNERAQIGPPSVYQVAIRP